MKRKASTVTHPRCLLALTLAVLFIVSISAAFLLSGSPPTVNAQRGTPMRTVVLDPSDGAIIGSTIEGRAVIRLDPANGAIISISTAPRT
jgi:hypothetical protein